MRFPLSKGCSDPLAHMAIFSVPVNIGSNEQTVQQIGMLTREKVHDMMKGRYYYAVDTATPFAASLRDANPRFEKIRELTCINLFYTMIENRVLFDDQKVWCMNGEIARLRSEIRKPKYFFEGTFARHYSLGLVALNFHVLDCAVRDSEILESLTSTDAVTFEGFDVLIVVPYKKTSW